MDFTLKRPCPKCPFRADVPGYLTRSRAIEIATSLAQGSTFPCHETTALDDDTQECYETSDSKMCAGAILVLENVGPSNQILRIAERIGAYDSDSMDRSAPVHLSLIHFIDHHGEETEAEPCHISDAGCLAPAGHLINGQIVYSEPEGDVFRCAVCGEWVCENCASDDACAYCADG